MNAATSFASQSENEQIIALTKALCIFIEDNNFPAQI
jgi:hypothetical protein